MELYKCSFHANKRAASEVVAMFNVIPHDSSRSSELEQTTHHISSSNTGNVSSIKYSITFASFIYVIHVVYNKIVHIFLADDPV